MRCSTARLLNPNETESSMFMKTEDSHGPMTATEMINQDQSRNGGAGKCTSDSVSFSGLLSALNELRSKWLSETTAKLETNQKLRDAAGIIGKDTLQSEIEWRDQRILQQQDCYMDLTRLLYPYRLVTPKEKAQP